MAFTVGPAAAFTVSAGQFSDGRREGFGIRIDTGAGRPLRRVTVEPVGRAACTHPKDHGEGDPQPSST
jgi:hypothetical protein